MGYKPMKMLFITLLLAASTTTLASAGAVPMSSRRVRIREITTVEGVRENSLIGYSLVVGLRGTGDQKQTVFTTQMLANILLRMGMQIAPSAITVKNIAAVFVTSSLPAFARAGTQMDVVVSSMGDAKSLEGGTLLLTSLRAEDGQIYATAQGALSIGGYSIGGGGGVSRQLNHPTVGRIANGAVAERDVAPDMQNLSSLFLQLREADFGNAQLIAESINVEFGHPIATVADSRRIEIASAGRNIPALLARIQSLPVEIISPTRVVVNEKTGTIVMGRDARLSAVSILQGSLSVEISTNFELQPNPLSKTGEKSVVPQTTLNAKDAPTKRIELNEGATVEQLVNGLQAIGATARDVVSILQALKAAGALQADLEVL
jgi:flagellar P-ring protein precursor FlgI